MLRSLYSGLSGLKTHQVDLDVIANNVANANTVGFKAGRAIFADLLSQTLQQAQAPTSTLGGVNPVQVGTGVKVAGIDVSMKQGALQPTNNPSDLAIQGDGFFVLQDASQARLLCRTGSFQLDQAGYLVHRGSGLRLVGWGLDQNLGIDRAKAPDLLHVDQGTLPPRATSSIVYSGNLDARTAKDGSYAIPIQIYDSLGQAHSCALKMTRSADNLQWKAELTVDGKSVAMAAVPEEGGTPTAPADSVLLTFDANGALVDPKSGQLSATIGSDALSGANPLTLSLDLRKVTMYGQPTSAVVQEQNGYAGAELEDLSVEVDGRVVGHYTDGRLQTLGQLALGSVINPAGLSREGNSLFRTTLNSGEVQYGQAASGSRGQILSSTLEMSNVDLTEEFSNLIVAQRGFQANTKSVTTSDQILQEVVNLVR